MFHAEDQKRQNQWANILMSSSMLGDQVSNT
jgi:hypothetical protein